MSGVFVLNSFNSYYGPMGFSKFFSSLADVAEHVLTTICEDFIVTDPLNGHVVLSCVEKEEHEGYVAKGYGLYTGYDVAYIEDLHKWVQGKPETLAQGLELLKC